MFYKNCTVCDWYNEEQETCCNGESPFCAEFVDDVCVCEQFKEKWNESN